MILVTIIMDDFFNYNLLLSIKGLLVTYDSAIHARRSKHQLLETVWLAHVMVEIEHPFKPRSL